MADSIDIVQDVIVSADKANNQISKATELVESASAISINVAAAVEQQSATTDSIAKSTETLRANVYDDRNKVETLGKEALAVHETAERLEESISSFK